MQSILEKQIFGIELKNLKLMKNDDVYHAVLNNKIRRYILLQKLIKFIVRFPNVINKRPGSNRL